MTPSVDMPDRLRGNGYRERVEVLVHEAPTELVTPVDIVRVDGLNRHVVVVPAGTAPPHWVQLTRQERQALVEPPQPLPDGWLVPGLWLHTKGQRRRPLDDRARRMMEQANSSSAISRRATAPSGKPAHAARDL